MSSDNLSTLRSRLRPARGSIYSPNKSAIHLLQVDIENAQSDLDLTEYTDRHKLQRGTLYTTSSSVHFNKVIHGIQAAYQIEGDKVPLEYSIDHLGAHISLSRNVTLKEHQIELFNERLNSYTQQWGSFPLTIFGSSLTVFEQLKDTQTDYNDSTKLYYIGLNVKSDSAEILRLMDDIDSLMDEFGLAKYFSPRKPHVSLFLSKYPEQIEKLKKLELQDINLQIKYIAVKYGQCVIPIKLGEKWSKFWPIECIHKKQRKLANFEFSSDENSSVSLSSEDEQNT